MKSVKNFESKQLTALNTNEMCKTKGGNTSITITAQIDICAITPSGSVTTLYCDRRRKKVQA